MPSTHRTPTTRSSHHHMLTALPCKRARALSLSLFFSLSPLSRQMQEASSPRCVAQEPAARCSYCSAACCATRCAPRVTARSARSQTPRQPVDALHVLPPRFRSSLPASHVSIARSSPNPTLHTLLLTVFHPNTLANYSFIGRWHAREGVWDAEEEVPGTFAEARRARC